MRFATKLRKYIEDNNIKKSHFAKKIGVSPSMMNKYLYSGSLPLYTIALRISDVTLGYITKEEIANESIDRSK